MRRWAHDHGVQIADVDVFSPADGRRHARDEVAASGHPELIVSVGGDGTFLRAARIAAQDNAGVLGVNVGRLGFLTEVDPPGIEEALSLIHTGAGFVEERLTLTIRASRPLHLPEDINALLRRRGRSLPLPAPALREPATDGKWGVALDVTAVNDVVFEKLVLDRQIALGVHVNGRRFASYSADALIVSSATGSTAYSFAAGGPVVSPRLDCIVFTPVAAHMIFDRSLVLAPDEMVGVRVLPESGPVAVSVDGQVRGELQVGDWVAVYSNPTRLRMVRLRPPDFFGRVRSRFSLPDAPATEPDSGWPERYEAADGESVPDDIVRLFWP